MTRTRSRHVFFIRFLLPASSAAVLALTCANAKEPDGNENLSIVPVWASTGTTNKTWRVMIFHDPTCQAKEKGKTVSSDLFSKNHPALKPVSLPVGAPVTLGFYYGEARYAQARECTFTLTLTPAEGVRYKAVFDVADHAETCKVDVTDDVGEPVPVETPEISCVRAFVGKMPNGRSGVTTWTTRPW